MPVRIVRAASVLLVVAGLSTLAWLNVSDAIAQHRANELISHMESVYSHDEPARLECKRQARRFNEVLAGRGGASGLLPYDQQLLYERDPMISYIQIPAIALRLPIYHGTEESVLMAGVGHLEGSSLPVGGRSSHCVLAAHSGMSETRRFDDIERLEVGDVFVIWTLAEPYAYRVFSVRTVLPQDASRYLGIQRGRDLVTLMTCTPYGINSHRLLVHAERCPYKAEAPDASVPLASLNARSVPLAAALGIVGLSAALGTGMGFARRRKGARRSRKAAHGRP